MAYAAVASLSETINIIFNYHQHSISPLFKTQFTYLQEHIIFLLSFLEDFPYEACAWEEKMREVTNEAEHIIELLLSTVGSSGSNMQRELGNYHDDLERVTKKIESIVNGVKGQTKVAADVDDDLLEIISQLRGGSSALESIPIVGIGGIGKTTLARRAYNHPLIVKHFEFRGWITVQDYRVYGWRAIFLGLLRSMNQLTFKRTSLSDEELVRSLFDLLLLVRNRYLIVLDDQWSAEIWEWLKDKIPNDFNGSRILMTSRALDVACCVGFYSRVHEMCPMNEDRSWKMLCQKVFKGGPCPPKLEYVGKMIAGNCRGISLVIEVVSGILAANLTLAAWEDIQENIKSKPAFGCDNDEQTLLQILHLSYIYLPQHLRPCLLYLGIFPEDEEIRASKLISLWEAEGFLDQGGSESFEENGEEHLEDLARRSLISVVKRTSSGKVKIFNIRDLVREMCIRQTHVDNFYVDAGIAAEAHQLHRRLTVVNYDVDFLENACHSTIRTVISWVGILGLEGILEYHRLLRILDFSKDYHNSHNLSNIPGQVFELFHLRYLACNYPCSIQKAILSLENLQTLVIGSKNQPSNILLPVEIWRMRLLRHLIMLPNGVLPRQENEEMFALGNLQTLAKAIDLNCSRVDLEMIPNIKKLGIWLKVEYYELDNLVYLQKLESLKIQSNDFVKMKLSFHPTLKRLILSSAGQDMKIVGSLPNLQVLKLRRNNYADRKWETNEGGFCELKFLPLPKTQVPSATFLGVAERDYK